jgi:hypothetical protein
MSVTINANGMLTLRTTRVIILEHVIITNVTGWIIIVNHRVPLVKV